MHSRLALFFRRPNFFVRYAVAALSIVIAALLYAAIDQWLEGYSPLIVFTVALRDSEAGMLTIDCASIVCTASGAGVAVFHGVMIVLNR